MRPSAPGGVARAYGRIAGHSRRRPRANLGVGGDHLAPISSPPHLPAHVLQADRFDAIAQRVAVVAAVDDYHAI